MSDDLDGEIEHDMFSPCPGCGNIGYSIMTIKHTERGDIQLMRCPEPFTECRTAEYYPREANE